MKIYIYLYIHTINGELMARKKKRGKKRPSAGLTKKERSRIVKKARKGGDIGRKGKNFKKIERKAAKRYGSKEKGRKVAAAVMWKSAAARKKKRSKKRK